MRPEDFPAFGNEVTLMKTPVFVFGQQLQSHVCQTAQLLAGSYTTEQS